MIRYFAIGVVVGLLGLRLLRSRWGSRLIGVSERVLDVVYVVALVVTGVLAVLAEYWWLLGVVALLLILRLVEEIRDRQARRAAR